MFHLLGCGWPGMMGHWKYIDFAFESCEFVEKQNPYYMYWGLAGYNQEHLTRAWQVVVEGFSIKKKKFPPTTITCTGTHVYKKKITKAPVEQLIKHKNE
jgi:hypothetical protein